MRQLIFLPEAATDIKSAYRWYEMQRPGLGREFTSAIEAATSRIQRSPERFRITVDEFRRVLVRRFPFEIFFEFDDERAVIYMIFHTSQQPDKWRERLRLP